MNEHDYALRDAAMAEFVDSYFKARPQLPRDRLNELLVEAGFKAAWQPDQKERAEKAEAELARLREREAKQKPVAMVDAGDDGYFAEILPDCPVSVGDMLYAATAPAVAAPAVPTDEQIHAAYRVALGQSIRERDMPEIRKFAIALLQSTEVIK